jgi:Bacterial regulatory helix-turn-helix protein, lysR family
VIFGKEADRFQSYLIRGAIGPHYLEPPEPMPPTLKQLRHFAALGDLLHFGRAAAACHVTQSALSGRIREL